MASPWSLRAIRRKNFEDPDALREWPLLAISLAQIGSHTIGYGTVQPGWRWSTHLAPIAGVAVHAAARIMALAGPSEVFASAGTVGLADGSGLAFEGQGLKEIKGLDRPIEIYRLS